MGHLRTFGSVKNFRCVIHLSALRETKIFEGVRHRVQLRSLRWWVVFMHATPPGRDKSPAQLVTLYDLASPVWGVGSSLHRFPACHRNGAPSSAWRMRDRFSKP